VGRGYAGSLLNQPKEIHSRHENGFRRFEEKEGTRRPHRLPGIINKGVMSGLIYKLGPSLPAPTSQTFPSPFLFKPFFTRVCLTLQRAGDSFTSCDEKVRLLLAEVV